MSISLRWISNDGVREDLERISLVRVRAYSGTAKDFASYHESLLNDRRPGEHLVAEQDGRALGSTTSLEMHMWVRGARLACQGVASVGTIRTARRTIIAENARGVASQLMTETVRRAREREQVVSALMPFRASFYEHFGYGIVERRAEWTIPSGALRTGSCDGLRYVEPADRGSIEALRQRQVERGRCDIETSAGAWERRRQFCDENGFEIVDRLATDETARSWMSMSNHEHKDQRYLIVNHHAHDSIDALVRQLQFLANQKDQFAGAIIHAPVDLPMNYLLRESQVPHRRVEHAAAGCVTTTRMQVRILDQARFFESQSLPREAAHLRGSAIVAVRETEGTTSSFELEVDGGRVRAKPTNASPALTCRDTTWASIACGELKASTAATLGMIETQSEGALNVVDALHAGPLPYSNEYF